MKGIFTITWENKKGKPAIAFDIIEVSTGTDGIPAGIPIKGSPVDHHLIEISAEIDGNNAQTLAFINQYLTEQGIEIMNYSERLPIM